jgi:hypothetical protein
MCSCGEMSRVDHINSKRYGVGEGVEDEADVEYGGNGHEDSMILQCRWGHSRGGRRRRGGGRC